MLESRAVLVLSILIISLLAICNYLYFGRKLLYPPVIFCSVWAGALFLVWLSGDFFYRISTAGLVTYVAGCLFFSLGSALVSFTKPPSVPPYNLSASEKILRRALIALILLSPFAVRSLLSLAGGAQDLAANLFEAARIAALQAGEEGTVSVFLTLLLGMASIIVMLLVVDRDTHKKRFILALAIALGLHAMTGGRAAIAMMLSGIVAIDWIRRRKLSRKFLTGITAILLVPLLGIAILVGKAGADPNASLADNAKPLVQGLVIYAVGGVQAFGQVAEHPNIIEHNWQMHRSLLVIANYLGFKTKVPIIHAQFLNIGPSGLSDNVYTMYFAYIDRGFPLMMAATAFVGFAATVIYRRALAGHRIAAVLYGYLFSAMLLAPFTENFFMGLSFIIRLLFVGWVVYALPVRWKQFMALRVTPSDTLAR